MLGGHHGRSAVETALNGLARRGLLSTHRGVYVGVQRGRDDPSRAWHRRYEDDWWQVTAEGRRAAGDLGSSGREAGGLPLGARLTGEHSTSPEHARACDGSTMSLGGPDERAAVMDIPA